MPPTPYTEHIIADMLAKRYGKLPSEVLTSATMDDMVAYKAGNALEELLQKDAERKSKAAKPKRSIKG